MEMGTHLSQERLVLRESVRIVLRELRDRFVVCPLIAAEKKVFPAEIAVHSRRCEGRGVAWQVLETVFLEVEVFDDLWPPGKVED